MTAVMLPCCAVLCCAVPQDHGRIDVSNPGNKEAESAFSAVEMALARLEGVSDVKPACYSQYKELYEARSTHNR